MFATAGTLNSEKENETFADHRENILKAAKALVEDTKTLVAGKLLTILRNFKALNDDLSLTLTVHQVAENRSSNDRRVDANMASKEHYLQYGVRIGDWSIY